MCEDEFVGSVLGRADERSPGLPSGQFSGACVETNVDARSEHEAFTDVCGDIDERLNGFGMNEWNERSTQQRGLGLTDKVSERSSCQPDRESAIRDASRLGRVEVTGFVDSQDRAFLA